MMKFLCHFFGCPNRNEELKKRVHDIEKAIKEDTSRLKDRQKELIEVKTALGISINGPVEVEAMRWAVLALMVTLVCILIVLILTVDADEIADFLAYAFPTMAAVLAGLGLVLGNEKKYYLLACGFVIAGLVSYTVSKYQPSLRSYLVLVTIYGLSTLGAAKLLRIAQENNKSRKNISIKKYAFYILLSITSIADLYYVMAHRRDLMHLTLKVKNLKCELTDIVPDPRHLHANLEFSCSAEDKH